MKNCIFFAVTVITFLSCATHPKTFDINSSADLSYGAQQKLFSISCTPEEKWEIMRDYMAPGADASNERPMPDILSEQEVLLKAAEYAYTIGALHPSYYLYKDNPELLTAKVETPILEHNFTSWDNGDGAMYLLTVVDKDGESLMGAYVRPVADADNDSFELTRFVRWDKNPEDSTHIMSKREAKALINSQFPGKTVSEPIAVRMNLEGRPYSHLSTFWYFTAAENNQRSVAGGEKEEFIIDASIQGYKMISGGVSNRSAISASATGRGSPHLDGARMAKLETPVHLLDRLQAARTSARSLASVAAEPVPPARFTPVPLN
jgi:hypothetical protein